jgi:hypothetical protein
MKLFLRFGASTLVMLSAGAVALVNTTRRPTSFLTHQELLLSPIRN